MPEQGQVSPGHPVFSLCIHNLSPFYYIDYTLAQICAFQFWKRANENREDALSDYVKLCKAGGSQSFLNLVDYANLKSPFELGCIKEVVQPVEAYLEEVNDLVL